QLHGLRARTEQGRELDDGTKQSRCRRYRRCKGQGGCVHSFIVSAMDVAEHRTGSAQADRVASQAQGGQGSHGGYERDWAKALREADIEVRIVDPKRVRSFAR